MEPMPEKLYYFRPPSVRIPNVSFSTSARSIETWWAARNTQEAVVWILALVLALAVGALVAHV